MVILHTVYEHDIISERSEQVSLGPKPKKIPKTLKPKTDDDGPAFVEEVHESEEQYNAPGMHRIIIMFFISPSNSREAD